MRMAAPHQPDLTPKTVYVPFGSKRWSATIETPSGPVTAKGSTMAEAQRALDELIARAIAVSRRDRQS
jgi:hypothetical protein